MANDTMNGTDGFFDLCVDLPKDKISGLPAILLRLYELGYGTVAINQVLEETAFESEKKKRKKEEDNDSSALNITPLPVNDYVPNELTGKLRVLNRITLEFSDPGKTHILGHSARLKRFDLYAVTPKTQNALQFACAQLNADLISINPLTTGLKLNRKLYEQAVERGLRFEIKYGEILKPEIRKMAIRLAHSFYIYGKSKNIVLSSGISCAEFIRSPYDIINVGTILGLNEEKSKASIFRQAKLLLLKAEKRRRGKAVFKVKRIKSRIAYGKESLSKISKQ